MGNAKHLLIAVIAMEIGLSLMLAAQTSAPSTPSGWTKVVPAKAMMAADGEWIQNVYIARDGYAYTGNYLGTFRVKTADLEANPAAPWQALTVPKNWPKVKGMLLPVYVWGETSKGGILASIGYNNACTADPDACRIGIFRQPTMTWTFAHGPAFRNQITSFSTDAKGNIYATDLFTANVYESKYPDNGAHFSRIVAGAYSSFGQPGGAIFTCVLINGTFYWGGEGALMSSPLDWKSGTPLIGLKSAGYSRNVSAIASDGGVSKAPTVIIAGARSVGGYNVQRWTAATGWVQLDVKNGIQKWAEWAAYGALAKGKAEGEFFYVGKSSAEATIMHSSDAGLHWEPYDAKGLPSYSPTNFARVIYVNPVSGAQYMVTGGHEGHALYIHR